MLRYAGGKTRAIPHIQPYIPDEPIVSPFFGGGAIELKHTKPVIANDICEPLINFWKVLQSDKASLQQSLSQLTPDKTLYTAYKKSLDEGTDLERAVKFFYVNRCCFSGCMTGGFSGSRFTPSSIAKLDTVDLANFTFHNIDYEEFLSMYPNHFAYIDPPYDVPNLYLADPFDHERLAYVLKQRSRWILSYNDTPRIRSLYAGYTIVELDWKYGMTQKKANEILILKD